MRYTFEIEKVARSTGGDKYICHDIKNFNIYFPQVISRKDGTVADTITIEIVETA